MKNKSLKEKFETEIVKTLMKDLSLKTPMAVPRVTKVVVNMGIGDAAKNKEVVQKSKETLAAITGQQPSVRAARVSIAGFGIRKGMPVGLAVTLRGKRMYDFLQKLFSIVLPRLRDFKGLPLKSFDSSGNYTIGIDEYTVFPEVDLGRVSGVRGLEITIVTSTNDPRKAKRLLELLGMPFEKKEQKHG